MRIEQFLVSTGLKHFTEPVHEELTNRIYGCDTGSDVCGGLDDSLVPPAVMAGVRWNDDPPFVLNPGQAAGTHCKVNQTIRLRTQPRCWRELFEDAKIRATSPASRDKDLGMIYRSHFGDLQFLHAMATQNGEDPIATRNAVIGWSEFAWRVAIEEYKDETLVRTTAPQVMKDHFGASDWRIVDLFALGSPQLKLRLDEVAFGSLLHVLQDSFASGHVQRESPLRSKICMAGTRQISAPGAIVEFHSYVDQDTDLHDASDSQMAMYAHLQEDPDVVTVGRELRRLVDQKAPWVDVAPFIECIFSLATTTKNASAASYKKLP